MTRDTRPISWITAARNDFENFPEGAQLELGPRFHDRGRRQTPDIAKGFRPGVFELALRFRGDAYRVVYGVQIGPDVWVVHAFQKKSKPGINPEAEIDLIHARLKRLKEMLR